MSPAVISRLIWIFPQKHFVCIFNWAALFCLYPDDVMGGGKHVMWQFVKSFVSFFCNDWWFPHNTWPRCVENVRGRCPEPSASTEEEEETARVHFGSYFGVNLPQVKSCNVFLMSILCFISNFSPLLNTYGWWAPFSFLLAIVSILPIANCQRNRKQ